MGYLLLIALAYLSAFIPLGVAFALKARRLGSIFATMLSLGMVGGVTWICSIVVFPLGVDGLAWPIIVGGGFGILCVIGGWFLFATSDENN